MVKFDVTIMEEGKGNVTYRGVEGISKGDAMRLTLNLHRDMMKIPAGIELVATARIHR